jgi:adenosylcobyric acid synthase
MGRSMLVLGTGANAGKTVLSVGLCRTLLGQGLNVKPFKAVAIARPRPSMPSIGRFQTGIPHHFRATEQDFTFEMNPVLIMPRDAHTGELYIKGETSGPVRYGNKDVALLGDLEPAMLRRVTAAVKDSYDALVRSSDVVVMEGAASPVEFDPDSDVPNIAVARHSEAAVLLCGQGVSGASAAMIGTIECLPEDVRERLVGFVLTNCSDFDLANRASAFVERRTGVRSLGLLAHLDLWDGPVDTHPSGDAAYTPWAAEVERGIGEWITRFLKDERASTHSIASKQSYQPCPVLGINASVLESSG